MRYLFLLAYRFLFKRKGSVFAASGMVAVTIFLIIFSSVIVGGVVDGVKRDLGDMNRGHIYISNDKGLLKRPYNQMISYILRNPDVAGATPRIITSAEINHTVNGQTTSIYAVQALGVDSQLELTVSSLHNTVLEGKFPPNLGSVVIDVEVSEELNAEVGSYIKVKVAKANGQDVYRQLLVIGIFDVPGPIGLSKTVIMHQNDLKDMLGIERKQGQGIMVRVKDPGQAELVKKWIQNSYNTDRFQRVETVDEWGRLVIEAYREGIAFVNVLMYSGMVASGLGVITILMMMVNSKVRDIGILRAIGMTAGKILLLFMIDGAILGIIGAVFGFIGGSIIVIYLVDNPVALFSGLVPDIRFNPADLSIPMFVGFTISVVASVFPSWRASRYQPEEAMRYI